MFVRIAVPAPSPGGIFLIEDWNADRLLRDALAAALADTSRPDHEDVIGRFRKSMAEAASDPQTRREPLTRLAIELVSARASARASHGNGIESMKVDEFWIVARRGAGELDPAGFWLDDLAKDRFGLLAT